MRQFFIMQSQRTMIQRSAAVHFHRLHHFQYLRAQRQRHIRGVCSIEHIFKSLICKSIRNPGAN